jgi:hypothetical protein
VSGSNACTTYHPEQYVSEVASELELLDFSRGRATDIKKDTALLRKPAAGKRSSPGPYAAVGKSPLGRLTGSQEVTCGRRP